MKKNRYCKVDYCDEKHFAKGFCRRHYYQNRNGTLCKPKRGNNKLGKNKSNTIESITTESLINQTKKYKRMRNSTRGSVDGIAFAIEMTARIDELTQEYKRRKISGQ